MKRCSSCKEEKDITDFCKDNSSKDKLSYLCKSCRLLHGKKYRSENGAKYYHDQQTYRSTPEGFVTQTVHNCKTRAKKKGFVCDITRKDIFNLLNAQNMKCAVTGLTMTFTSDTRKKANPFKCSVDRVNSDKGYTLDNIRLVCWAVNQMKADRTDEEFKFWITSIHKAISSQA